MQHVKPKKTAEEQAQARRRWQDQRNERRRLAYANDPQYREKQMLAAREAYRKLNDSPAPERDCRQLLDHLEGIGSVRRVIIGGEEVEGVTFTRKELAQALGGYAPAIIGRWITNGQLPAPVAKPATGVSQHALYTEEEVRAIMEVLGPHQAGMQYFRSNHYATIDAIAVAVHEVRNQYGIE